MLIYVATSHSNCIEFWQPIPLSIGGGHRPRLPSTGRKHICVKHVTVAQRHGVSVPKAAQARSNMEDESTYFGYLAIVLALGSVRCRNQYAPENATEVVLHPGLGQPLGIRLGCKLQLHVEDRAC